MSTEEKFHAAVNVIRSLPKNGSYQPSNELMLRFYGYFKQATQGPVKGARPALWNVVGRAKYDAWKKLGDMSKTEAMKNYVIELHKIVETMSYTENVANFLEAQAELDSVPLADLEMVAGDVIERVRSQPNSPFASREASPQRVRSSLETSPASSLYSHSPEPQNDSDHSDDEYIDTIDSAPEMSKKSLPNGYISENILNGHGPKDRSRSKTKKTLDAESFTKNHVDISQEISNTVHNLKSDLDRLTSKVSNLEKLTTKSLAKRDKLITFRNISPSFFAFIVLWPFITHSFLRYWSNRK